MSELRTMFPGRWSGARIGSDLELGPAYVIANAIAALIPFR
jgi:hypothetical protein